MDMPQYAILRFAKYQGPAVSGIEAHNERTKEKYASNPDVDISRSSQNIHLITPKGGYRAECERIIREADCRVRKDSVRMVEALVTASPDFFTQKDPRAIRAYFRHALKFITQHQNPDTILSAVVHMDEKTPHMHVTFVPLTEDNRLCAKEIVGNKKKLTWWQDEFWKHMVGKYPDLERGRSAGETGRDHIPTRIFKKMTRLTEQREQLDRLLDGMNPFNAKSRAEEIEKLLDSYIPAVDKMDTRLRKYRGCFLDLRAENRDLKVENARLASNLEQAQDSSILRQLEEARLKQDYEAALNTLNRIPPEILKQYSSGRTQNRQKESR